MISLAQIVDKGNELLPMKPTAARLAQLLVSPEFGIDEVVRLISFDQAITASVLRMANSAGSGVRYRIESVREAVVRLGSGRILRMVMATSLKAGYLRPMPQYGYSEDDLWRHGIAAAAAAECLPKHATVTVSQMSFTAALLHDIGKLLMSRTISDEIFIAIRSVEAGERIPWSVAEERLLGFSHADAGAALCSSWNLPDEIVNAIANHHKMDLDFSPVTDAVRVSNAIARSMGEGLGNEGLGFAMDSNIAVRLGLSREGFERLCADTVVHLADIRQEFEEQ